MGIGRPRLDGQPNRPAGQTEEEAAQWLLERATWNGACLEGRRPFVRGYPVTAIRGKFHYIGHIICTMTHGPRPDGFIMRHLCDNKRCIRPEHIEWATPAENLQDARLRGRAGRQKLMPEHVREIRRRYCRTGHRVSNARELAVEFGIGRDQVTAIVSRRTWAWLE